MVGGWFCYRSYFMHSIVLLLWVCLYYVEASSGKHVIHKNVGDTVELSSGLPTEGVTAATWKYGGITAADKDVGVFEKSPFKDRSELNLTDFTLTVRKLTLQDSGDFIFVSEVNDKQRPSVIITLQVHEPIAKPDIKINSTRISSNESCKVLLECSTTGDVSYKWTVGKQTLTGPRQQYIIREQDGETNVTCTVSSYVSEKSAFQTVKCSKDTDTNKTECSSSSSLLMFIAGLFTGVLITLLFLFLLYCIKSKGLHPKRLTQSETINQEENQQHVYSALSHGDRCVYETVRGSEDAGPGGSQIQCIKSD
ncbi:uncharacterized protein LOC120739379 isoform X2 [Simochromis diagramma]|uniref:uncharacterized protein LOC120739379 isoform X2 n=1 Tax=Simochromis diagramma TaxID=43689 RepID=UPI001A7EB8B2|nr:uncharacterized protein LOC120739379 isoform X2 [Simochromis diagramma]